MNKLDINMEKLKLELFKELMDKWWWKKNNFAYRINNSEDAVKEAMAYIFDYFWNELDYEHLFKNNGVHRGKRR